MDLYLPDEFYALSEAPNARRKARSRGAPRYATGSAARRFLADARSVKATAGRSRSDLASSI